jgi:hypothetical protein
MFITLKINAVSNTKTCLRRFRCCKPPDHQLRTNSVFKICNSVWPIKKVSWTGEISARLLNLSFPAINTGVFHVLARKRVKSNAQSQNFTLTHWLSSRIPKQIKGRVTPNPTDLRSCSKSPRVTTLMMRRHVPSLPL